MHLVLVGSAIACYLVGLCVVRHLRLRNVPGPFLCSVTDLYRAYRQCNGNVADFLTSLHSKYGPVVRIGPTTVSVSKASAVPTIYTMRGEFKKAQSYNTLAVYVNGAVQGSVADIQDEEYNTALKRTFGAAFAAKNIQDYEDVVDGSAQLMFERLQRKNTVDVFDALRRFQIDFLLKAAFSEDKSVSKTDEDISGYTFQHILQHWTRWQSLHNLEHLIYKSLVVNKIWELCCTPVRPLWAVMTSNFLQGRLAKKTSSKDKRDLLDKWLDAQMMHSDTIDITAVRRMVSSTLNAGFDTTAWTMTMMLFELLKNPATMATLRDELQQIPSHGRSTGLAQWTEVNKLPYLDAVIKETMRMHAFLNIPLDRVVPEGGVDMLGYDLPAGTVVGCSAVVIHQDPDIFGDDASTFNPSRWLTEDISRRVAMERGSLGFGSGKRGCLGKHIAVLEMKKVIASLLTNFQIEFTDADPKIESVDGITNFPKPINLHFTKLKTY